MRGTTMWIMEQMRMRTAKRMWIGGLTVAAVSLTMGCGPADDDASMEDGGPGADTSAIMESPRTMEGDSVAMDREQRRTSEELALRVASLPDGEAYLTDGTGRSLYMLEGAEGDASMCDEACQESWPPFEVSSGQPQAQGSVDESLIGSIEREGEMSQVTYAGHPLFYYSGDREPGDRQGQEVDDQWGEWYLVTPEGEHLEDPEAGNEGAGA